MSTRDCSPRLETPEPHERTFRERAVIRHAHLADRILDRHHVGQYVELFDDAPRKPDALYEMQRAEPRITRFPDDALRAFIKKYTATGQITRRTLIRFCSALTRDFLTMFPDAKAADDTLFCALFALVGEMVEAQVNARVQPTRENIARAVRVTDDMTGVAQLLAEAQRASA